MKQLDPNAYPSDEKWLLVFCNPEFLRDPDQPRIKKRDRLLLWILGWLKPGYRHVFAMRRSEALRGWIVINPSSENFYVYELPDNRSMEWSSGLTGQGYFTFLKGMEEAGIAKLVWVDGLQRTCWTPRWGLNCVSIVKHSVGLGGMAVTPWQLYRKLVKSE